DSGFGVPCFEGGDRFLAQVETVGGGHRQESKLFIYFNRPDLYTDCYNADAANIANLVDVRPRSYQCLGGRGRRSA
ncbi:MAG: hypothetical protein AAF609_06230, partial [Cyanobacteria bacterium P01_C01_bin.120]